MHGWCLTQKGPSSKHLHFTRATDFAIPRTGHNFSSITALASSNSGSDRLAMFRLGVAATGKQVGRLIEGVIESGFMPASRCPLVMQITAQVGRWAKERDTNQASN